jgi:hypothetical protein
MEKIPKLDDAESNVGQACGDSGRLGKATTKRIAHTPCKIVERRVRAPVKTLAEKRAMTPETGERPNKPANTILRPRLP